MGASDNFKNRPFDEALQPLKRLMKKSAKKSLLEQALARVSADKHQAQQVEKRLSQDATSSIPSEEILFRKEMQGVAPLIHDNYIPPQRETALFPARDEEGEVMAQLADLISGRADFDFNDSDEYIEGIAQGLDRRLLKKLRQGTFAVQAHLDLHGKTRIEAHPLVESFIVDSRHRGRRCVLIVHGRGLNSKDQIPILKENLKGWLARGRIAKSVLAFCSARPTDGGVGAVYVLLRK